MTKPQLVEVMLFHLRNLGTCKHAGPDTVLGDCLPTTSPVGGKAPAEMFKDFIVWTVTNAGYVAVTWPQDWLAMTVQGLAELLAKDWRWRGPCFFCSRPG